MHVVLSGYYGFGNVGDEAILFAIIQSLRGQMPDIQITVLSENPEYTAKTYQVQAVKRDHFFQVRRVIKASDGLISGGGSLLQDKTSLKSIPYYAGIIQLAKRMKKPVFIYSQGIGPVSNKMCRWIVKKAINQADGITVRDERSKKLLEKLGVKDSVTVVPDPVMGLELPELSSTLQQMITVSVRNWHTKYPYKLKMARCLDQLARSGYNIVFVPMHGKRDEQASAEIAALMTEKSDISNPYATIEEKIELIGKSRLLIGIRLHSLIFAAITTTPFVALSYDPKIDAFAEICNQPVAGHIEGNHWTEFSLLDTITKVLNEEKQHRLELRNIVQRERQKAKETATLALETLTKDIPCPITNFEWTKE